MPQVIEDAAERIHVVEDDAVSNQLVVLDEFTLLVAVIGRESFVAPEGDPLGKSVEGLALIGCSLNERAQFGVAEIVQEEFRPDRIAQFAKGLIKPVLAAVSAELS